MSDPILEDIATPKVRAWLYIIQATLGAAYVAAEVAYSIPAWVTICYAAFNTAAALIARSNTPADSPPPDPLGGVTDGRDRGAISPYDIVLVLAAAALVLGVIVLARMVF